MNQALSTKFADDYKIKEKPKNINIEVGSTYMLSDGGSGTRQVKIVSIRKLDQEILIYYKWRRSTGHTFRDFFTGGQWLHDQRTLSTFKAQLLQYGEMKELEIVYNDKKQINNNKE